MEPITRRTVLAAAGFATISGQAAAEGDQYPRNPIATF